MSQRMAHPRNSLSKFCKTSSPYTKSSLKKKSKMPLKSSRISYKSKTSSTTMIKRLLKNWLILSLSTSSSNLRYRSILSKVQKTIFKIKSKMSKWITRRSKICRRRLHLRSLKSSLSFIIVKNQSKNNSFRAFHLISWINLLIWRPNSWAKTQKNKSYRCLTKIKGSKMINRRMTRWIWITYWVRLWRPLANLDLARCSKSSLIRAHKIKIKNKANKSFRRHSSRWVS